MSDSELAATRVERDAYKATLAAVEAQVQRAVEYLGSDWLLDSEPWEEGVRRMRDAWQGLPADAETAALKLQLARDEIDALRAELGRA